MNVSSPIPIPVPEPPVPTHQPVTNVFSPLQTVDENVAPVSFGSFDRYLRTDDGSSSSIPPP